MRKFLLFFFLFCIFLSITSLSYGQVQKAKKSKESSGKPVKSQPENDIKSRFVPLKNGIIKDSTTGLQWTQDAGSRMAWNEANAYVQNLKIGDNTDWRLPSEEELESLIGYCKSKGISLNNGKCAEYYNRIGFKNVQSGLYWSSTFPADTPDFAADFAAGVVSMSDGSIGFSFKSYDIYVWPVRSLTNNNGDQDLLYPVNMDGKLGYIDKTGKVVIKPQFEWIGYELFEYKKNRFFHDGLAKVSIKDKTGYKDGYIDKTGKIVIQPKFEEALPFSEGLAAVSINGKWGYIDKTGMFVIKPQFYNAKNFSEGLAAVARTIDQENDHFIYGYINKEGTLIIEAEFYDAEDFSEGLAAIGRKDGSYGYIDKRGGPVYESQNVGEAFPFSEGLAAIRVSDGFLGKIGYMDKSGDWAIEPRFATASSFSEGLAAVRSKRDGTFGYIDKTGVFVITPRFGEALTFSEGLAMVKIGGGNISYIDKTGKTVWPQRQLAVPKGYPSVEKMEQLIKTASEKTGPLDWGIILNGVINKHIDIQMVEIERIGIVNRIPVINREYLPVKANVAGSWKGKNLGGVWGEGEEVWDFYRTKDYMIYKDDYGDWKVDTAR